MSRLIQFLLLSSALLASACDSSSVDPASRQELLDQGVDPESHEGYSRQTEYWIEEANDLSSDIAYLEGDVRRVNNGLQEALDESSSRFKRLAEFEDKVSAAEDRRAKWRLRTVHSGDLRIRNNFDLHLSQPVTWVTGDVTTVGPTVPYLHLPNLQSIGGALEITFATAVTAIALPQLKSIGGTFVLQGASQLTDITEMASAVTLAGSMLVTDNTALCQSDVAALAATWGVTDATTGGNRGC